MVWESNPALGALVGPRVAVSWQTFDDWRSQNQAFERMGGFQLFKTNLTGFERPEELPGAYASTDFFPLLGVQAQLGRTFLPRDEVAGTSQVVVVSGGVCGEAFLEGRQSGWAFGNPGWEALGYCRRLARELPFAGAVCGHQ